MIDLLVVFLSSFAISFLLLFLSYFLDGLPRPVDMLDLTHLYQLIFILLFFVFVGTIFHTRHLESHIHFLIVISQFSSIVFFFRCNASETTRFLLNFCFLSSTITTLTFTITESEVALFSVGILVLGIFFLFLPSQVFYFLISLIYIKSPSLFEWSFHLSFQILIYFILIIIWKREQGSATKKEYISFLFLCLVQTLLGIIVFNKFFWSNYLQLAALVSGALIIFLCVERETRALRQAFLLYMLFSIFLGINLIPSDPSLFIGGISQGFFVFLISHLFFFVGLVLFNKGNLPRSCIPFFFEALFFLLNEVDLGFEFLAQWLKGMDLLIFLFFAVDCFYKEDHILYIKGGTAPSKKKEERRPEA